MVAPEFEESRLVSIIIRQHLLGNMILTPSRHIAVWNLVGALGFTLCGALGYAAIVSTKVSPLS